MAMHRRAPSAASTSTTKAARARTTTASAAATARARAGTATAITTPALLTTPAALDVSDSSFRPGIAASGTATALAPDTPPAPSSFVTSGTPSGTFAAQGIWGPQSHSYQPVSAGTGASATDASSDGLSKPALYGIIAGGSVAGVLLLALLGFCCWKRRKNRAADDDLGWRDLDTPAARPVRDSQFIHNPADPDRSATRDRDDSRHTGTESFSGPLEKPWAQQSFSILSSFNEKSQARGFVRDQSDTYSTHSGDQRWAANRQELLHSSRQGLPRSQTNGSFDSFAPPPSIFADAHGRDSTAQSVNSVIGFSGSPRRPPRARAPSPVQHAYPPPRGSPPPPRADSHGTSSQERASPGRGPITTRQYSSLPFARASGVPSIDYAQQRLDDDAVEQRVLEVMMGAQPDVPTPREQARSCPRSKTDTIIGLTDAYGGADGSDWEREHNATPNQQQRPARTSSRKNAPSASTSTPPPPLPVAPVHEAGERSEPSNLSRVDSKPLRELEALFERMPNPTPSSSSSSTLSGSRASDTSARDSSKRYTREDAFSLQPLALARKASLAKYRQTSRPAEPAPLEIAGRSLAGGPIWPRDAATDVHDDPLSVSVAERDVLSALGGMHDSNSLPDLTISSGVSPPASVLDTPSSEVATLPDFQLGHAPPSGLKTSYLDFSDTPTRPEFESLDEMNARKHADPSYRSATMSVYGMYD
ncbi:hypothetical protein JCM3774_006845 [Rhodotorula dairenensis]